MKKFAESLDTAVITTRFILQNNSPILYVFHFSDGFWQFSGKEEDLRDEDYRVVSLQEIIEIDSSVCQVADLPSEGKAFRQNVTMPWQIL